MGEVDLVDCVLESEPGRVKSWGWSLDWAHAVGFHGAVDLLLFGGVWKEVVSRGADFFDGLGVDAERGFEGVVGSGEFEELLLNFWVGFVGVIEVFGGSCDLVASLGEDVDETEACVGIGFDVSRGVGGSDVGDDDGVVVVGFVDLLRGDTWCGAWGCGGEPAEYGFVEKLMDVVGEIHGVALAWVLLKGIGVWLEGFGVGR